MSPLAAKADCAERTTNSQQKPKGLPSLPTATKDRLLQSTQSLLEALPQGPINIQQHATRCVMPMLPSPTATDSGIASNGTGNDGNGNSSSDPAIRLRQGTTNGGLPATAAALRVPVHRGAPKERLRQDQYGTGGVCRRHAAPSSLRSVARLRTVLRRLRAIARTNGTKFRICLTARGLARAKAALLKARSGSAQQAPVEGVAPAVALQGRPTRPAPGSKTKAISWRGNSLGRQKPEPVNSGQAMITKRSPNRDQDSGQPQQVAVASHQSGTINGLAKGKATPTATEVHSGSSAPDTQAAQGPQKRTRHTAQSLRTGSKGVYTEDSIRVYLQEIGRIRLLRPDEEIELARKIADLLYLEQEAETYFHENERYPSMSEWAEQVAMPYRSFKRRLKLGRRAKEKMVQSNLRLVVSIAKKYMNRGLSFQDLIQEGSLGLVRAAEKFDHEKGYKFSTYATWWIRQAITRAIADQSRTIRLPVHLYETISRIKKSTKTLSQELGRKPTEEEIAERMEMTIEKLRFIAKSAQLPISLETPIGKEEDSRLGDFIESGTENPDQDVAKNLLREDLESVLATLNPRERDVLRLRYGLDDGRMKTLEDIGQIFEVTRERIRQIEARALRKLRHPNRNGVLKEYIK